jgi:hypothetical protein
MGKGVRNLEKVFAHGKMCSQHGKCLLNIGKGVRNIRNTLRNIMIRRLICFLIRIMWLEKVSDASAQI